MSRRRAEAYRGEVSALYVRDFRFDQHRCAYCGEPRECMDHVPPLRTACDLDLKEYRARGGRLVLLPSCGDCNALLGRRAIFTYPERLAALYHAYSARIRNRTWSEDELAALGDGLRGYIEAQDARNRELIHKFHMVERRMLYAEATDEESAE